MAMGRAGARKVLRSMSRGSSIHLKTEDQEEEKTSTRADDTRRETLCLYRHSLLYVSPLGSRQIKGYLGTLRYEAPSVSPRGWWLPSQL